MQTYSAVTHHRVHFVEGLSSLFYVFLRYSELVGQLLSLGLGLRYELVQRRIKQTECYRLAVHYPHCALYRCLDVWFKFSKCGAALIVCP